MRALCAVLGLAAGLGFTFLFIVLMFEVAHQGTNTELVHLLVGGVFPVGLLSVGLRIARLRPDRKALTVALATGCAAGFVFSAVFVLVLG